jgi:hypothetical protein
MPNPIVVPRSVFQSAIKVAREQAYRPSPGMVSQNATSGNTQQAGQAGQADQAEKK